MIGLLLLRCYFNFATMCMGRVVALLHVAVDGQPANKRNCKHPHDKNVRRVETNKYIHTLHGLTCLPIVDYFTKNSFYTIWCGTLKVPKALLCFRIKSNPCQMYLLACARACVCVCLFIFVEPINLVRIF